jgi:hypothetical protein
MYCFSVASIIEMKALQASVEEMEKKYIEFEKKCSDSLNTQIKMEVELQSKDNKLVQFKKESEKDIKKLENKMSKLQS